ncbi:MAG: FmdB family transcriptional regulator [Opitutae bacterium]|nr:FmdB family transcriptional regulator [Opitutae bacterium]|tara:strand:+ start:2161 stop:2472 length:312 start_codon:yes stop_codon:yes gene_type:complete
MPTYDYQCEACNHEWELFQSMNDSPVKRCPKCKKQKAKRLLGLGAGLIFKGTGFYETDYKKKSGGEPKDNSSSSSGSTDTGTSSTKTEKKQESKPKKEKVKAA